MIFLRNITREPQYGQHQCLFSCRLSLGAAALLTTLAALVLAILSALATLAALTLLAGACCPPCWP